MTALATIEAPAQEYVKYATRIPGDVRGFKGWAMPLLQLLAHANGCAVQVLAKSSYVSSPSLPNVVLFGDMVDVGTTLQVFAKYVSLAQTNVCVALKGDGITPGRNDEAYCRDFYAGFIAQLSARPEVKAAIAANAHAVSAIGEKFPESNAEIALWSPKDHAIYTKGLRWSFEVIAPKTKAPKTTVKNVTPKATVVEQPKALAPAVTDEKLAEIAQALADIVAAEETDDEPTTVSEVAMALAASFANDDEAPKKVARKRASSTTARKPKAKAA